jgi:hypothetical protein
MGFIKDNTNTFEVYLTDLGKQKFFDGGFKDAITYFSLCDGDSNYNILVPNSQEVLAYNYSTVYSYDDIVVDGGGTFYRYKSATPASGIIPSSVPNTWEKIILFNPTNLAPQPIPTINHVGTKKTSLGNGAADSDDYINDVFVQVSLRGKIADDIEYRRALLGTKQKTQKDYVMFEPAINTNATLNILTYINYE